MYMWNTAKVMDIVIYVGYRFIETFFCIVFSQEKMRGPSFFPGLASSMRADFCQGTSRCCKYK